MRRSNNQMLSVLVGACLLVASVASSQTAARRTATVTANAAIYIAAAVSPTPLRVAAPGTVLRVVGEQGNSPLPESGKERCRPQSPVSRSQSVFASKDCLDGPIVGAAGEGSAGSASVPGGHPVVVAEAILEKRWSRPMVGTALCHDGYGTVGSGNSGH